jgi:transposase
MSKEQLHKRFSTQQVKAIIDKYQEGEIKAKEAYQYLDVSRPRFYQLIEQYEKEGEDFSVEYVRQSPTHAITPAIEAAIKKELLFEKEKIIDNKDVPTDRYNYSYIQRLLQNKYQQTVSVPTIIARAKKIGCYQGKRPKKIHDREVITNYSGELVQHDSSYHLWAPDAQEKWYLITSLDDYSRALLYAELWDRETTWNHIQSAQSLMGKYGLPFQYYVDQLRVFRYVKNRDSSWVKYTKFTDDVDPQWKQVMKECGVGVIYALSPQAKGKIERPYQWLQDHIVRTCVREGVTTIVHAQEILKQEVNDYNWTF